MSVVTVSLDSQAGIVANIAGTSTAHMVDGRVCTVVLDACGLTRKRTLYSCAPFT